MCDNSFFEENKQSIINYVRTFKGKHQIHLEIIKKDDSFIFSLFKMVNVNIYPREINILYEFLLNYIKNYVCIVHNYGKKLYFILKSIYDKLFNILFNYNKGKNYIIILNSIIFDYIALYELFKDYINIVINFPLKNLIKRLYKKIFMDIFYKNYIMIKSITTNLNIIDSYQIYVLKNNLRNIKKMWMENINKI